MESIVVIVDTYVDGEDKYAEICSSHHSLVADAEVLYPTSEVARYLKSGELFVFMYV